MARLHLVVAAVVLACAVSQAFACESAMSLSMFCGASSVAYTSLPFANLTYPAAAALWFCNRHPLHLFVPSRIFDVLALPLV